MNTMTAAPQHALSEAVLRPVRGHHAFESCVEQLAMTIRLGVYPLGAALAPERGPAARPGRAPGGRTGRDHPGPWRGHRGHPEAAHAHRPGRGPHVPGEAAGLAGRAE